MQTINYDFAQLLKADKHLKEGSFGDLNRRLKNCFIPYDCSEDNFKMKISNENFNNFLIDRAAIIIDRIKEVVGDSWKKPQQGEFENENLTEDEYVTSY